MSSIAFDHCVIVVSNWERSNRFYAEVVGLDVIQVGDGRWAYRLVDAQLNVQGPDVSFSDTLAKLRVEPGTSNLCFVWAGPIDAHQRACPTSSSRTLDDAGRESESPRQSRHQAACCSDAGLSSNRNGSNSSSATSAERRLCRSAW